jgi:hypothetical protein
VDTLFNPTSLTSNNHRTIIVRSNSSSTTTNNKKFLPIPPSPRPAAIGLLHPMSRHTGRISNNMLVPLRRITQ